MTMLGQLLNLKDQDRAFLNITSSDPSILLINNLGGVSPLELGAITEEICAQLEVQYRMKPLRVLSGTYMTSLNGKGFSISILKLVDTRLGPGKSMLDFFDAPLL
jgi:triose/dihydroxyacetone kinase / FAD-AMP lyase (cyclizing)